MFLQNVGIHLQTSISHHPFNNVHPALNKQKWSGRVQCEDQDTLLAVNSGYLKMSYLQIKWVEK